MCKLYALQTTMTRSYARKVIAEKAKTILKTESDGLGISLNVDGVTRSWQCGQSLTDSAGTDVTVGLGESLKMATLIMHGRTSTSSDKTVSHSHPRLTPVGPLMHNGIVFPKSKDGWKANYDLDTDYLAELAERGELQKSAQYLTGYAGVLLLQHDGTLIVQNQGANLYMRLESENVEFGTTKSLCDGVDFDCLRAEILDGCAWIFPIESMGGRQVKYDAMTNIGLPAKTQQTSLPVLVPEKKVTGEVTKPVQAVVTSISTGRTKAEMGPNPKKKGKYLKPEEKKEPIPEHISYDFEDNWFDRYSEDWRNTEDWHQYKGYTKYSFGLSSSDIDDDLSFMKEKVA